MLLDRGPFTVEGERALLREHRIDVLVTKDSGGPLTSAKLAAARAEGVRMLVVRRPPLPAGVDAVSTSSRARRPGPRWAADPLARVIPWASRHSAVALPAIGT